MASARNRPPPRQPIMDGLRREDMHDGRIAELAAELARAGHLPLLSEEEREASRRRTLARLPRNADLWVFGYGSLMWNPLLHVKARCKAVLHGYHRQFCLSVPLGRGTPEQPGLMLALMPGGSVCGIAFAVDAALVEEESRLLWRREMLSGAYRPRWVRLRCEDGPRRALTFVCNRQHGLFVEGLGEERMVEILATAAGRLGRCSDYLHNTVLHLDELGISDGSMHRLLAAVERYQQGRPDRPAESG